MNKTKEFVVYKITNTINAMCYIGITVDYERRIKEHFCSKDNCYIHRSIQKYGKEKFTTEIIFECDSWKNAQKEEINYIKAFNTMSPNGYNLTCGGDGAFGLMHSEETRKKISESNKGQKRTKKTRKKISESNKGKRRSKKTRKKMSESTKIFSKDQILEIRKMLFKGVFQRIIAKKFGVTQSTIGFIKQNKHYADIQLPGINLNNLPKEKHRFSNDQILEIKKMLSKNITYGIIAEKFNVANSTICRIKRNKVYTDIQL